MKYIARCLLVFLLLWGGCGPAADVDAALLSDAKKEAVLELFRSRNGAYDLKNLFEDNGSLEIEIYLRFNPLSFTEVMPLTDSLAYEVARLFDYKVPVVVGAIYTVEGSGAEQIFGESLFYPRTGKTEFRLFGRDYVLQHGDP